MNYVIYLKKQLELIQLIQDLYMIIGNIKLKKEINIIKVYLNMVKRIFINYLKQDIIKKKKIRFKKEKKKKKKELEKKEKIMKIGN